MSGITSRGPGFVTFAAPPSPTMEEMGRILRDERGGIPPFDRIPTAKKAAAITTGLALGPVVSILATPSLRAAATFFYNLFGKGGESAQEKAVNDLTTASVGGPRLNPGLDQFLNSKDPSVEALRNKVMGNVIDLQQIAGQEIGTPAFARATAGMTSAELIKNKNEFRAALLADMKDKIAAGLTAEQIKEEIGGLFASGTLNPDVLPDEDVVDLMIESVVAGMEQPAFAANPTASTDATQPDPGIQAESATLEAIMAERDRRKKEDELLGLKVGQKAQQLDNIERSPDQWLARVQAMRQALFARQTPRTPMQMRNDGLVQQVYYSTRVQQ